MKAITANELKTKGVRAISQAIRDDGEATITVRGKGLYVVMDLETCNRLRVYELEAAFQEAKREVAEGKYVEESVEDHIRRISRAAE